MNQSRKRCYRFLTRDDYRLLDEMSVRQVYQAEDVIIRGGCSSHALYIVRKGSVRFEMDNRGDTMEIDRMGVGEFVGIMSFLDDAPMAGAIIANEPVELDYLDVITMNALLASIPGFSSRFYLTIAVILAERLGDVVGKMASDE